MKMFFLILNLLALSSAMAGDPPHRLKSFYFSSGKAVFVDFLTADYAINYDVNHQHAQVVATISFEAPEAGYPVFDSFEAPTSVVLNGKTISVIQIQTPSQETYVRVINGSVTTGKHQMIITTPLKEMVTMSPQGVRSAFWASDLSDRNYLERYMPASFEYDQVKMSFEVSFEGVNTEQVIYTNGVKEELKRNNKTSTKITYPAYYTSSSIYFHTVPKNFSAEINFSLKSVDGREVPVVIYVPKSTNDANTILDLFKRRTTEIFHELEGDYGAWPHPALVIYNAGLGGMEYCGATITSQRALGHELFHSYFARGVMPANGNAGWIDEALASWRDDGYRTVSYIFGSSSMSSHPYYTRITDKEAYTFGKKFMGLLNGKLSDKGGLKPFMRYMVEEKKFSPLSIDEFMKEMSQFYGVSVESDFKRYTFDDKKLNPLKSQLKSQSKEDHPIHRKMGLSELRKYL